MKFLKKIYLNFSILFVGFVLATLVGAYVAEAVSKVDQKIVGYAWSSNIGWISFNNGDVGLDDNNNIVGYAWSSNIGWIKFGDLAGFPDATIGTNAKLDGNNMKGWARAVAGMTNIEYATLPAVSKTSYVTTNNAVTTENWIAYAPSGYGEYGVYLSRLPARKYTFNGQDLLIYDTVRVAYGGTDKFKKDPQAAIKNATAVPVGSDRGTRWIFNSAQMESESPESQKSETANMGSSFHSRFACATNVVNAPSCHRNNGGGFFPAVGFVVGGPIYTAVHDSGGGATMTGSEIYGTFQISATTTVTTAVETPGKKASTVKLDKTDNRGGWDGWISLSSGGNSPGYGVTLDGIKFKGFAWGADVVGWMDWSPAKLLKTAQLCSSANGLIEDGETTTITTKFSKGPNKGKCQSQEYLCEGQTLSAFGDPSDFEQCTVLDDCEERDGISLKNGESHKFFKDRVVVGKLCASANLTCTDGVLVGQNGEEDSTHVYSQCLNAPSYKETQ